MLDSDHEWHAAFTEWFSSLEPGKAVAVSLPGYRPDLVEVLARVLGLSYVDFRKERLAMFGWEAGMQPLAGISECALDSMARDNRGVLVQNAEALLAMHDSATRRAWFAEVLGRTWPHHLVLPVVLYAGDLPNESDCVFAFGPASVPKETLLEWLPSLR